ncbi:MAG: magnesium transporter CorA family protein [Patescibacteria group bacterium]
MMQRRNFQSTVWLDMCNPTYEEIQSVIQEFNLDPFMAGELKSSGTKQKVELHSNAIFLILHVPAFKQSGVMRDTVVQEIDFLIGEDFLITTRYDHVEAMERSAKILEVNSTLNKSNVENETIFVFFRVFKEIYNSLIHELEDINTVIDDISKEMFNGKEKQMVFSISYVTRTLLEFKKTVIIHKQVLKLLEYAGNSFFGSFFAGYVSAIRSEYGKIENSLSISKEVISNLHYTNTSLVNTKQNEIMLMLTSVTFLLLPLSFIVSLFFLDTVSQILPPPPYDLWILLTILIGVTAVLVSMFRHKGWL